MRYAFDTLVKVQFNHSYFSDNVFNGLAINVSRATLEMAGNMGLLIKPFRGGFNILYDQNFAGKPRTRENILNERLTLEFTLTLNDPHFYNYTAGIPDQINNSVYYFRNSGSGAPDTNLLHKEGFVSTKDVCKLWYFKERFFNKPFAKLDLSANPGLETEYFIKFQASTTYWRYILMSDYLQDLKSPAIIGGENSNIVWAPSKVNLPDNRQVNAFISSDKLNLSQYAGKTFQLVENYETMSSQYRVVIRALPLPDVRLISGIANSSNNSTVNYSDILIH